MAETPPTAEDQELFDASTLVASMLWQDFEPLSEEFISRANNAGKPYSLQGGSVRLFSTEETGRGSLINVMEVHCTESFEGQDPEAGHYLALHFEHPYSNFLFSISFLTGEAQIETRHSITDTALQRYPAIKRRIIGGLSIVADQLFS